MSPDNLASWISWGGAAFVWIMAGFNVWVTRRAHRQWRQRVEEGHRMAEEAVKVHQQLTNADHEFKHKVVFAGYVLELLASHTDNEQLLQAIRAGARQYGLIKPEQLQ